MCVGRCPGLTHPLPCPSAPCPAPARTPTPYPGLPNPALPCPSLLRPALPCVACRCLQDNKYQKGFGKDCKEEVRQYEVGAASDYRLNYRLARACKADIDILCKDICKAEEGQVSKAEAGLRRGR